MIKVGIIGGSGYTAGELLRLLINHPDVTLRWVHSNTRPGERIDAIHKGLVGELGDMTFTGDIDLEGLDVLFLCTRHGHSQPFLETHTIPEGLRLIDLSRDYRMASEDNEFVYGLPELNRRIMVHDCLRVACPGSIATGIALGLLPLARNLLIGSDLHITSVLGSTGLGAAYRDYRDDYSSSNSNVVVYKPFDEGHVAEVRQTLTALQQSFDSTINLVPIRGSFARGLLTTIHLRCNVDIDLLKQLYRDYYDDHNFTFIVDSQPDLKDVVNTNKCLIHLERIGERLLITTAIDNLLKGASGTAVHVMNLMCGLHERVGLQLKASAF